jgi:hypothetical protein
MARSSKYAGPWHRFDAAWFARHQATILGWLNGWWLPRILARHALRIDTTEVLAEIGPHYYRVDLPDGQRRATFRTHAKYSKRVYYSLFAFWWALHFLDWLVLDRWLPALSFGFDTLPTVYPQAGSGGANTTCDGYVRHYHYPGQTWANMHDWADGTSVSLTGADTYYCDVSAGDQANRYEYIQRGGFSFNTAAIGAGATVTAANFSIRGTVKDSTYSVIDDSIDVVAFTPANAAAFVTDAFDQFGTTSFANVTQAAFSTSGYTAFALNAAGLANIAVAGISKFGTRLGCDRSNTEPTESDYDTAYMVGYYADQSGTGSDPKLDVTYTPAATAVYKPALALVI